MAETGAKKTSTRAKSSTAKAKPAKSRAKPRRTTAKPASSRNGTSSSRTTAAKRPPKRSRKADAGVTGTIKQVASKAKGPAIAVGAAAAGIAGGLVLNTRNRRKTVLGIPVPKHLPTVDPKAVATTVGQASKRFAKTSKSVSKDLDRAGDQAERIGKILG